MKRLLVAVAALCAAGSASATEAAAPPTAPERWQADHTVVFEAAEADLAAFQWLARPVVVFADSPNDPRFTQQMELLAARPEELAARDVVIITDTDPRAMSDVRKQLRPRGFMLVLIAKDGTVSLRKPFPWDVRELSRAIDKMPLRQQEMRERHAPALR
ncbi:DUF4174 domain-containing protein [Actibacterium sp. MT2.3-13A]|uniref:DUF4174 domain-containing protein n=1 Tax=Actibacterium sp. MT2.3-13A TaxID=2828332 RepID=UPI001BAA192C|nr:DUF4174 domain-containing protein [Actibacterium sp. MT2.3-13A]